MRDPDHWLWRLDAAAWIAAGQHELDLARTHASARRRGLTHARRGAGMALNGVLVAMADRGWSDETCTTVWGRSYVDHLRILAGHAGAGPEQNPLGEVAATLAKSVTEVPVVPPAGLVQLSAKAGGEVQTVIDDAQTLLDHCAAFVVPH